MGYRPLDIRQSLSLQVFRYKLKSYDFDGNFYFDFIHSFLVEHVSSFCYCISCK